jgi:hypothetical protein
MVIRQSPADSVTNFACVFVSLGIARGRIMRARVQPGLGAD